jgi:hypothetical protein
MKSFKHLVEFYEVSPFTHVVGAHSGDIWFVVSVKGGVLLETEFYCWEYLKQFIFLFFVIFTSAIFVTLID